MNKRPLGMYFMEKVTAADKLDMNTYEMDKAGMVDKFVICRPPLWKGSWLEA